MQRFSFVVCLICCSSVPLFGQPFASHTLFPAQATALFSNPALMCSDSFLVSRIEFATNYRSRLQMKELAVSDVSIGFRIKGDDAIAIGLIYDGYALFNTSRTLIGYAKRISSNINLGVQMEWRRLQQGDLYGSAHSFMGGLGAQVKLTDQLSASMSVYNPNRSTLGNNRTPMTGCLMIHWYPNKQCIWLASIQQTGTYGFTYSTHLRYHPSSRFHIQLGASSGIEPIQFAFGFRTGHMELIARSSYHELLGFSPGAGIRFFN